MLTINSSMNEINIEWIHVVVKNIRSFLLQMMSGHLQTVQYHINIPIVNWFKHIGIDIEKKYYESNVENGHIVYKHRYNVSNDEIDGLLLHFISIMQHNPDIKMAKPDCELILSMLDFNLEKYLTNNSAIETTIECLNSNIIFPSFSNKPDLLIFIPVELILCINCTQIKTSK